MFTFYPSNYLIGIGVFHKCESEPLLAEVFDGCSDQVDIIIDYQEPVVSFSECPDLYRSILRVVSGNIQLQVL